MSIQRSLGENATETGHQFGHESNKTLHMFLFCFATARKVEHCLYWFRGIFDSCTVQEHCSVGLEVAIRIFGSWDGICGIL